MGRSPLRWSSVACFKTFQPPFSLLISLCACTKRNSEFAALKCSFGRYVTAEHTHLLPQPEQLGNCTCRWRDLSLGRRKLRIRLKRQNRKNQKQNKKIQIRRTVHKETVDVRISSERQQHYDSVFCSVFTCSMACPPAGVLLNGRVRGGGPASQAREWK